MSELNPIEKKIDVLLSNSIISTLQDNMSVKNDTIMEKASSSYKIERQNLLPIMSINSSVMSVINFGNFAVGDEVVFAVKSKKTMFCGAVGKITKITEKLIYIVGGEEVRYNKADITDIKKKNEKDFITYPSSHLSSIQY